MGLDGALVAANGASVVALVVCGSLSTFLHILAILFLLASFGLPLMITELCDMTTDTGS